MPHKSASGPGPVSWACRLCGGGNLRLEYTQGNCDEFRFYRCMDCRMVNFDLAGGLDQAKYEEDMPDPRDPIPAKNRAQTDTFRFLSHYLRPPGHLLEIGCGNGRLLYLAQQAGWSVAGLELSPVLAESVSRTLGLSVTAADIYEPGLAERLGAGSWQGIVLRHVLEHLPNPLALMALFRQLLGRPGYVLLEFPNIDGVGLRWKRWLQQTGLYHKTWPPDYHPGHCNEYNRASFNELAVRSGFEILVWKTYARHPAWNRLVHFWPIGSKARTLIRIK